MLSFSSATFRKSAMSEPIRLAKRVVELFSCSRREAELYIEGGWVLVDGRVVEEPQFMVARQKVELHRDASLKPLPPATILLNKPPGYSFGEGSKPALKLITPENRFQNDPSRVHLLKRHFQNLSPTLPIGSDASGLVVFTQNGTMLRKLIDDGARLEQELIVEVSGTIIAGGLKRLARGMNFNERVLPPCTVSWQNETRLRFAIKDVGPGQIRFMCEQVGLQLVSIKRIRIGRVPMSNLPLGQWRYLADQEKF